MNAMEDDLLYQGLGHYKLLDTVEFRKVVDGAWDKLSNKMGLKPGEDLGAGGDKSAFDQAKFMLECEPKHAKSVPI